MATRLVGPVKETGGKGGRSYIEGMPLTSDLDHVVRMIDFDRARDINTDDYTITIVDGGSDAAQINAVQTGLENGVLLMTTNDADNDSNAIQSKIESVKLNAGKKVYFEARVKVSDADDCDAMIGLSITDTTPNNSSDRINFQIDEGNASILCQNAKNSTETSTDSGVDAADDTYVRLGFLCDGVSRIKFFVNRNLVAQHSTNIPDDEELCLTLFVQTGAAAAKSMSVDYVMICKER